ncbi:MAG: family 16 glycoside hydrolase, partial [Mucilaginibacter sp.]
SLKSAARVTVFHNGVLVQNNFSLRGDTPYIGTPSYRAHGATPIKLQAHGDKSLPISYRNIWVREL